GDLDFEACDFVLDGVKALFHLAELYGVEACGPGFDGLCRRRGASRGRVRDARGRGIGRGRPGGGTAPLGPEVVLVVAGVNVDPGVLHFDHTGGQFVDEVAVVGNEHDGTAILL